MSFVPELIGYQLKQSPYISALTVIKLRRFWSAPQMDFALLVTIFDDGMADTVPVKNPLTYVAACISDIGLEKGFCLIFRQVWKQQFDIE